MQEGIVSSQEGGGAEIEGRRERGGEEDEEGGGRGGRERGGEEGEGGEEGWREEGRGGRSERWTADGWCLVATREYRHFPENFNRATRFRSLHRRFPEDFGELLYI